MKKKIEKENLVLTQTEKTRKGGGREGERRGSQ